MIETNNTTIAACLAIVMLAMAFVYVTADEEADAAVGYHKVGDLYYKVIDDADTRTYTEKEIGDYDGMIYIDCETIKPGAFEGYDTLVEVLFSNKVKTIGENAFKDCVNLTYVRATWTETIGDGAFSGSGIQRITLGTDLVTIGEDAFRGCDDLWLLPLWATNVTSLPAGAFADSGIRMVDLRKITSLDPAAFSGSDLEMQMVRSSQGRMVGGVPILINDDDGNFGAVWKTGTDVRFELGLDQYIRVTEVGGTDDVAVHDAPGYRDTVKEAGFTPESGKDYQMTFRHATVVFHEITGLEDRELSSGDFPYTLPRPALGDLALINWTIDGLGTGITSVTLEDAREVGGLFVATPVYGTATVTFDHSAVGGLADASDLQASMDFTFGDRYPELPDLEGYRHTGWMVDGVLYKTDTEIEVYEDHRASSVWEPTKLYTVKYLDGDGAELGRSTHGLNALVTVDARIVPEESVDERFSGWSIDGSTVITSFRVTSNVDLIPVFDERPLRTIEFVDGDSVLWETTGYEGRTVVIDVDDPTSDTRLFQGWYLDGDLYHDGDELTVTGDMTLDAIWEDRTTYSVRFSDGTGTVHTGTAYDGVPYTIDADDPTMSGKVFLGWIGPDGGKYQKGDSLLITAHSEFTAEWRDLYVYTVHFDDGHGNVIDRQVTEGESLVIDVPDPVADDGVFLNWKDGSGQEYSFGDILVPKGTVTLTASWRPLHVYDIVFDDGHGWNTTLKATEGRGLVITVADPSADGEVFLGWADPVGTVHQNGDTLYPESGMTLEAQWRDLYVYRVTFDDGNGGSEWFDVTEGDSLEVTVDDPAWDGKVFLHWTDDDGNTYSKGDVIVPGSPMTVTAQWRDLETYIVTFDDGRGVVATEEVTEGDRLTIDLQNPVWEGRVFLHWSDQQGNRYAYGETVEPSDHLVLTAQWRDLEVYRVTFDDGQGDIRAFDVTEGESLVIDVEDPVRDGHVFLHWTDLDGNHYSMGDTVTPDGSMTLTAQWRPLEVYRITFDDGFGNSTWVDVIEGESLTIRIDDPVAEGKVFQHWTDPDGNTHSRGDIVTPDDDITLIAQWRDLEVYRISFVVGDDTVSWFDVTEGDSLVIGVDDPSSLDMAFEHWSGSDGNRYAKGDMVTPTSDMTLTTEWRDLYVYKVTFDDGFGNSTWVDVIEGDSLAIDIEDPVTDGKVFLGWIDPEGNTYSCGDVIIPTDSVTLTAQWRDLDVFRIVFDDGVSEPIGFDVLEGDEFTVSVEDPRTEGRFFEHWAGSDGIDYSHGDTFVPVSDIELTAVWREPYVFTVSFDDGHGTTVPVDVLEGSSTEALTAPVSEGEVFVHWTDADGNIYRPGDVITPTGPLTLTAHWRDLFVYRVTFDDDHGKTSEVLVIEGDTLTITVDDPVSAGEVFMGWLDPEGGMYLAGDEIVPQSDMTLTASWRSPYTYEIVLDDGHGRTARLVVTEGSSFTIPDTVPTADGEVFVRWDGVNGVTYMPGDTFTPDGDVHLDAVWRDAMEYEVVFDIGSGETETVTVTEGESLTIGEDPVSEERIFVNWTSADGGTYVKGDLLTPVDDMVLTASWRERMTFQVTYVSEGETVGTDTATEGIPYVIGIPVEAPHGKRLSGWMVGEVLYGDSDSLTVDAPITADAVWTDRDRATVSFDDGRGIVGTYTGFVGDAYIISVDDPVWDGKMFICWSSDVGEYRNGDSLTLEGDVDFDAIWRDAEVFEVTIGDKVFEVTEGDSLTIDVEKPESEGREFLHWTDGDGNEYLNGDVIVPDGDVTLTPVWRDLEEHTVTFISRGATVGTTEFYEGGQVTISCHPSRPGYSLSGWSLTDGGTVAYRNGQTLEPDGDLALYAVWRLNVPVYPSDPDDDPVRPSDPAEPTEPEPTEPSDPVGPIPEEPEDDDTEQNESDDTAVPDDGTGTSTEGGSGIGTHAVLLAAAVAAMMVALMAVVLRRS